MRCDAVSLAGTAEILIGRLVRSKVLRNIWRSASEVDELPCNKQTVHTCVVIDVLRIWSAFVKAMVRIRLNPLVVDSMINVIAVNLL